MRRLKIDLDALRRSEAEEMDTREGLCEEGIRVGSLLVSPEGVVNSSLGASSPPCLLSLQDLVPDPDAERSLLGKGSSGAVRRCVNRKTGDVLAVKEVKVTSQAHLDEIRRELAALYTPHGSGEPSSCAPTRPGEATASHNNHYGPATPPGTLPTTPAPSSSSPTFTGECAQLVQFYGAFSFEGSAFMAIECLDGSLSDIHEPVPTSTLAHMTRSMLRGLAYLHRARHLIHRDLKPSNVLFRRSTGEIKITDFGVSSNLECSKGDAHTFVGTVTYMSPERLRGSCYSFAADIWSLGLVVAELALGVCPYQSLRSDSSEARFWALLQHLSHDEPVLSLPEDADPDLADFIQQCVQKSPELRPNCMELLTHPFITNNCTAPTGEAGDAEDREHIRDWFADLEGRRCEACTNSGCGCGCCGAQSGTSKVSKGIGEEVALTHASDSNSPVNLSVNLDEELDRLLF